MAKNINGSFLHVGKTEQIGQQIIQNYGPDREELEKLRNDLAEQLIKELPVKISQETRAIVGEIVGHKVDAVLLRLEKEAESEEVFRKSVSRNFVDLRKDMQAFKAELKEQFDALYDKDSDELENLERLSRDAAHQADEAFGKIIKTLSAMKDIAQEFKETIRLDYTFELLQGWASIREGWFDTAKEFFDKASRQMANEAEAYFGMYLADCKIQVLWDCVNCRWQPIFHDTVALDTKLDNNPYCNKAMQVANIGQKTEYEAFNDEIRYIKEEFEKLEDDGVDYDCFICVKVSDKDEKFTEDSKDAEGIYQLLSNPTNGFKPFYSKCTLKNTTGKNDEAHILYALYKAKCLIVVCSNREYLKTPWVKNEYTRYIDMMNAGDKSRDSIFIASCGTTIKSHQLGMSRSIQSRKYDRTNLQDNFNLGKEIVDFVGKFVKNNTGVGIENNSDAERTAREAAEAKIKEAEAKVRELEKKLEEERNAREENARKVREETEHQAREKGAQAKLRKFEGDVKPERQVSDEKVKPDALPADYPTLQTYNKGEFEIEGTLLKKYKGEGEEVKIPYGVTRIGYSAFKGCESLTSIIIPNSVTSIEIGAFEDCTALKSITIPNSIKSIDVGVFRKCKMLTSIAIPNSVTSIGDAAFYGCKGLTSIVIPSSVTSIGYAAFSGCEGLTSIIIPNSATSIGDAAFYGCKGLTSIIIPSSVTNIGKNPFRSCKAFESITVEEGNPNYKAEGNCLIEKKTGKLIAGCKSSVIPDDVTSIGEMAFKDCESLTSIVIPSSVTSIGREAFLGCMWLKSIAIPTSVTRIGGRAFYICIRLQTVYYGGTSEQWNKISIFDENDKLKNAQRYYNAVAEQAEVIKARENQAAAESASKNREKSKTESKYPDEKVKPDALPADYPTLQNYNKEEFEIEGTLLKKYKGRGKEVKIPYGVTSIEYSGFFCCEGLSSIIIPNSVTSIGDATFHGCKGLTSIVIPNSVTSIVKNPFGGCVRLESITAEEGNSNFRSEGNCLIEKKTGKLIAGCKSSVIPDDVTSIGEDAFSGCEGLTSIIIPSSVTSIGGDAFFWCKGLTSIIIPSSVTSIEKNPFMYCTALESITVEEGNPNYKAEGNCLIERKTGKLLAGCKSSVIPNGVTSIEYSTFWGCEGLTSIIIPSSVTSIDGSSFSNCTALESITVEEENPEYKAEGNCIIEEKTGKLIAGCKSSVIPNGVTSIGDSTFWGCEGLTSIIIPNSVTNIEGYAFYDSRLTSIVIPNSVTNIGWRAFHCCSRLHTVYYEGTREQWDKIAISDNNDKLKNATRYYYSKRRKLFGNYWHWDKNTHTPKVWVRRKAVGNRRGSR